MYKPYQKTGRFLKVIRMRHTLSQGETAEKLKISKSYYCEIEKGVKFPIDKKFILKLESFLDFDTQDLVDRLKKEYLQHKKYLFERIYR